MWQTVKTRHGARQMKWYGDYDGSIPLIAYLPAGGRDAGDFDPVATYLTEAGIPCLSVQHTGAGESHIDLEEPTFHDIANDLADALEAVVRGAVIPIGHAFGNRIVRCMAVNRPDLVKRLILLAAGGKVPGSEEAIKAMMSWGNANTDAERLTLLRTAFFSEGNDAAPWMTGNSAKATKINGKAASRTPVEDWWHGGEAEMLIIQGAEDQIAPPANGHDLKASFPDRVKVVDIEKAAHALTHEQPGKIAEAIIDFVKS